MIPFRAKIFQGIVVDVGRIIGCIIFPIVIMGKRPAFLAKHSGGQLTFQLQLEKGAQVHAGWIVFDLLHQTAVFFQEILPHQVMFHAPAQVNGQVVIGGDLIHWQFFFLNGFQVPISIVHFHQIVVLIILTSNGASGDSILAGGVHGEADTRHLVQQSVCIMLHFILQLVPVEGNHLIEVDLLAARQDAELAAILRTLGASQNNGTQLCVLRKGFLIIHGVTEAQPGIAGNGQASQNFQQANGPVPPLILHRFFVQLPAFRQGDGKLRPLQLVFRQLLGHIHPVGSHAHGDQGVVVPLLRGRHHADVHMDVGGNDLVEHILELAEMPLDVPLNGLHLLLSVDLRNARFLILGCSTVRVVLTVIIQVTIQRFPADFQCHLLLRQADARAAGDGVLIICRKTDGLPIVQFHIILQHIGGKVCQEVPQIARLGVGTQHLHLVFAEHIHAVSIGVHTALAPVQAKPDPVEDGQFTFLHHVGKTLIEPGLKHHAAGVDAGGVFLAAAGGHHLGEQFSLFQQIFLFAHNCHHDVGAVLLGGFHGILPHIVVFCVQLSFPIGDGIGHQTDGGDHIAYFKDYCVVALVLIFLHGDVPFFLHVPDKLILVPFPFGQQDKSHEGALVAGLGFFPVIRVEIFSIFIQVIDGFMLQPPDELLKAVRQMGDPVVVLLIHMDHRRFPLGAAGPVVQENHIVSGAGTVADGHADGRILPLVDHKLAA